MQTPELICLVGVAGSGKSTLAKRLAAYTGLQKQELNAKLPPVFRRESFFAYSINWQTQKAA